MNAEKLKVWKSAAQKSDGLVRIYPEDLLAIIAMAERTTSPVSQMTAQANPHATTFPAEIWLNVGDGDAHEVGPYKDLSELSWCWESIDKYDVRYVRADLVAAAPQAQAVEPLTVRGDPADPAPIYKHHDDGTVTLTNADKMPSYAAYAKPQPVAEQGELTDDKLMELARSLTPNGGDKVFFIPYTSITKVMRAAIAINREK